MIFASVGTERFPFDRLIRTVDEVAGYANGEPVLVQLGHSTYIPQHCQWVRFFSYQELVEQITQARIVVTHAGAGSFLLCAQFGKRPIAVPRRKRFNEHVDDHQVELAARMAQAGYALLAEHPEEILPLILGYEQRQIPHDRLHGSPSALAKALGEYLDADGTVKISGES